MPEIIMYDEQGHLTLDGMKAEHAAGRSVLWPDARGRNQLIRPGEALPNEAVMAKGRPDQEAAARQSLQAQIAQLQTQLSSLDITQPVQDVPSHDALTGSLPGVTAIHPDMVGAYPPQAGDGAQPIKVSEVAPEHRGLVSESGPLLPQEPQPEEPQPQGEEPQPPQGEEPIAPIAPVDGEVGSTSSVQGKGSKRGQP